MRSTKCIPIYKCAVGLDYEEGSDEAPILSIKGQGLDADQIVKIAKRFGVPVVEKGELAQGLSSLGINQSIPVKLYEAVAIVLHQIKKTSKPKIANSQI